MNSTELRFERPWLLLLLIPALILILLPWMRLPKRRRNTLQKVLPMAIHSFLALMLVLLLAGTSIARITNNQGALMPSGASHRCRIRSLAKAVACSSLPSFRAVCRFRSNWHIRQRLSANTPI